MEQNELRKIGYRQHHYEEDPVSNTKQCFHCKFGQVMESNREKVQCNRWKMTVEEDDFCDYFEFATYWAFDCTDEDRERRRIKLENVEKKTMSEQNLGASDDIIKGALFLIGIIAFIIIVGIIIIK